LQKPSKKFRVALVDNMNNNFFVFARYLRDFGVEADLFLIPERKFYHFDPKEDTWFNIEDFNWIKEFPISYSWKSFLRTNKNILQKTFSKYDRIIACGYSVGLLNEAGIRIDLFIPYGSDLINIPFFKFSSKITLKSSLKILMDLIISFKQKKGIKTCRQIIANLNWKKVNDAIIKIGCKSINLPRLMIYLEESPQYILNKYSWLKEYDFIVFSPTRHLWKENSEPLNDYYLFGGAKRNDKLIIAFKRLIDLNLFNNPILVLCEYGNDVKWSKVLIDQLNIGKFVKWLPLLPRKEVLIVMSLANFVADQFREGMSGTSAGTTNEALSAGIPVLTNTDGALDDPSDPYYSSPILQALTEQDILKHFVGYAENPSEYKLIGKTGLEWFHNNLSYHLCEKYLKLLK